MSILKWIAERAAQHTEQEIAEELAKWSDRVREGRLTESIDPSIPIEETITRHKHLYEAWVYNRIRTRKCYPFL